MRSVKTCLKRVLGRALLNFEELTTMLTEVEAVLNSRPLSYVHNDVSDPQPLKPSHFLVGKTLTSLLPKTVSTISGNQREQRGLVQEVDVPTETFDQLLQQMAKKI